MNMAAKMVAAYFDSKDLRYSVSGDDEEIIEVGMSTDYTNVRVKLIFGEDCTDVGLRAYDIAKIPEEKIIDSIICCNQLNSKYRWVKFYFEQDDRTITVSEDAVIDLETAGAECFELFLRMVGIIEKAYPVIMKTIY